MALIKREELLEIAEQQGHVTADDILSADIIDAAPVVHGKWKRTPVSGILFCSVCDQLQRDRKETPYCPLCGARMDGGEGHEAN